MTIVEPRSAQSGDPVGCETAWHRLPAADVLSRLDSSPSGLASVDAERRLAHHGSNELEEGVTKHPLRIVWEQISTVMVLILIAAAALSLALGKLLEAGAIGVIVVLFTALGFFQEHRAEQAIAALRRLSVPVVKVIRDGRTTEVDSVDLVVGDVVLLEAGNRVPADLRLVECANLRIQEAALTGESEAVDKEAATIDRAELPLGDRRNMAYLGTTVSYGRGMGIVTATGMQTELGKIAGLLQDVEAESTPLQKRLDYVGKVLAVAGILVAAAIAVAGYLQGESLDEVFLLAVGIAVAVVPEGLPAVVTITLALGARRMLARNALIRKLPAVETLGSVTVICSDKTGTLTENRMTVTVLDVAGHRVRSTRRSMYAGKPGSIRWRRGRTPSMCDRRLLACAATTPNSNWIRPAAAGATMPSATRLKACLSSLPHASA